MQLIRFWGLLMTSLSQYFVLDLPVYRALLEPY